MQQTYGQPYALPPASKGPSIIVILVVLGLVVAVAAFVLFCGVIMSAGN
jgi:flagellar basal body-associated protein FliL